MSVSPRHRNAVSFPAPAVRAFTLVELLVVFAIVGILLALLLPTLGGTKARGQQVACVGNLRQLALACQVYMADNEGRMVPNTPATPSFGPSTPASSNNWVIGNLKLAAESTNSGLLRLGKLFPYANHPGVYRCPGDQKRNAGELAVRSYSMNGWMGSRFMLTNSQTSYRTFVRDIELAAARPAALWMIADEHEATIDDGWFRVTMDNSLPFASFPGARHDGSYALNFADAHVESFKLRDPTSFPYQRNSPANTDWIKLAGLTTVR